jgi:hypothetical protein
VGRDNDGHLLAGEALQPFEKFRFAYVDRLLLFEKGRLLADGPRDKVLAMLQGGPKRVSEPSEPA